MSTINISSEDFFRESMSVFGSQNEIQKKYTQEFYEWRIPDFSNICNCKRKCYYSSKSFSFAGATCHFRIYPEGYTETPNGYISLYVWRETDQPTIAVTYTFGLKNNKGIIDHLQKPIKFVNAVGARGVNEFFKVSELLKRKSEFFPDDSLTITCHLECGTAPTTKVCSSGVNLIGKS